MRLISPCMCLRPISIYSRLLALCKHSFLLQMLQHFQKQIKISKLLELSAVSKLIYLVLFPADETTAFGFSKEYGSRWEE